MHEEECLRCNGQGTVTCSACQGKRKVLKEMVAQKCRDCNGTGRVKCPANCRGGVVWIKD